MKGNWVGGLWIKENHPHKVSTLWGTDQLARHGAGYRNLLEDEQRAYLAAEYQAGILWDCAADRGGDGGVSIVKRIITVILDTHLLTYLEHLVMSQGSF